MNKSMLTTGIILMALSASGFSENANTATGTPISVRLVEVSTLDFLRVISEVSGLNILVDPDVTGSLSIHAEAVPWDELLETVLESQGLIRTSRGNLIRISRKETLQQQEKAKLALKREAYLLERLVTNVEHLDHAHGKTLIETLEALLTERGKIRLDERTNALIIRDVEEAVHRISQLVNTLDQPERQIEIEARIVEATTSFSRQLGAMLGLRIGTPANRYRAGISVLAPIVDPVGSANMKVGGELDTVLLDAAISAAEATGEARMISKPRVSTLNNNEARIVQGAKIPIPVQMNYTTNVRYETAALHLSVKPQITGHKSVSLEIKVENSVPDFTRTVREIPTILTSESHTKVLVANGTTTVIGGIFVETDRKGEIRVPGLSALPVFGRLFKRTDKHVETREILFFITSRIRSDT